MKILGTIEVVCKESPETEPDHWHTSNENTDLDIKDEDEDGILKDLETTETEVQQNDANPREQSTVQKQQQSTETLTPFNHEVPSSQSVDAQPAMKDLTDRGSVDVATCPDFEDTDDHGATERILELASDASKEYHIRKGHPMEPVQVSDYKLEEHHFEQVWEMLSNLNKETTRIWNTKRQCAVCRYFSERKVSLQEHLENHLEVLPKGFKCPLCCYTAKGARHVKDHLIKYHQHESVGTYSSNGVIIPSATTSQVESDRDQTFLEDEDIDESVPHVPCCNPDNDEKISDEALQVTSKTRECPSTPTAVIEVTHYKLEECHISKVTEMLANLNEEMAGWWEKKVRCAICLYSSDTKVSLQRHVESHLQPLTKGYKCPLCLYTCKLERYVREHLEKCHQEGVRIDSSNTSKHERSSAQLRKSGHHEHPCQRRSGRHQTLILERDADELPPHVIHCGTTEKTSNEAMQLNGEQSHDRNRKQEVKDNSPIATEPIEVTHYELEEHYISEVEKMLAKLAKETSGRWDEKIKCAICLYSSDTKVSLQRHVENHLQPLTKGSKCPLCLYTSKGERHVRDHLENYHHPRSTEVVEVEQNKSRPPAQILQKDAIPCTSSEQAREEHQTSYACSECAYKSKSKENVADHFRRAHPSLSPPVAYPLCILTNDEDDSLCDSDKDRHKDTDETQAYQAVTCQQRSNNSPPRKKKRRPEKVKAKLKFISR